MATVKEHYDEVLSDVYSWMYGGFDAGILRNKQFFDNHHLSPKGSGIAVDLGCGCGFQSIPLAKLGYTVTAIDQNCKLLDELKINSEDLPITRIQGELLDFEDSVKFDIELLICMTDTILHLETKEKVQLLFNKAYSALESAGKFIITFRDLTYELNDLDRFLPIRSDENTVFTCFLEFEPNTVKVHDIVYRKSGSDWSLFKSFYRKLRLSNEWIIERLSQCGFKQVESEVNNGLITVIAQK